ncbi:ATP-binding protein [Neorhizobium sp. S3-V5DH]|uniref:ATP-binding protein n=1 Tax=Neorhizobium sp. S3-V5DH TaxID=2485166 RepID=UPI0010483D77|nr:ATP-binding protein [Neorhizobium sp. S3-V5DH]TCV72593.1 signal transduction histidine kinase [Neorhizobium sp. S3-V5DH]
MRLTNESLDGIRYAGVAAKILEAAISTKRDLRWLTSKRLIPRTLPAWVLIVLVAVLLVSQTSAFVIMSRDRMMSNETIDFYRINERTFWLAKLMAPLSPDERRRLSSEMVDSTGVLSLSASPGVASAVDPHDPLAELEDILSARLARFGIDEVRFKLEESHSPTAANQRMQSTDEISEVEENLSEIASDFLKSPRYIVSLKFADAQWLNIVTPQTPTGPLLASDSLSPYLAVSICVVVIAFWAVWRLTAPYQLLEAAVRQLGDDLHSPPLLEKGSRDFRDAARALNQTQASLQEHFEERELLAAALAHDLRTPLTRMRLRLALIRTSALKKSLEGDIADIEETVESVIGLAKLNAIDEPPELIDLWSMADTIAEEYDDAFMEAPRNGSPRLVCLAPPVALRRALRNLIENAIKYGRRARISLQHDEENLLLSIKDEGPGIPEKDMNTVLKPYVRLEQSRNRETGGSGLGLAIASGIARRIKGEVQLRNHPAGGLEARLILPRY